MKAAGNALKGASNYLRVFRGMANDPKISMANDLKISVPIHVYVDYRGFRLLAMPLLPINGNDTLVYGSCDTGQTIHADRPPFNELMKISAEKLHLAR